MELLTDYCKGYSPQEAADILEEDEKTVAEWYKKWGKKLIEEDTESK